jgi:hypothetical protein
MAEIEITQGTGYFALNGKRYPKGNYEVEPHNDKVYISNMNNKPVIVADRSDFYKVVEGSNVYFATMDLLMAEFDAAFSIGGGDGEGVTNVITGEVATGDILLDNIASRIYGETTPLTGNITIDETGSIIGGSAIIYHNDSSEPLFLGYSSRVKIYGNYELNVDNTIMIAKNGANTLGVVITQDSELDYYLKFLLGDYISIPHNESINFERTDAFAFSFDMKTTIYNNQKPFINKALPSASFFKGYEIKTLTTSGILQFGLISNNVDTNLMVVRSTNAIPLDTWTTIHVSYDGSSNASGVKIWFNKVLETNNVIQNNLTGTITNSVPLLIGRDEANLNKFNDDNMDNLKIYDQALTQSNVDNDDVIPIHSYNMNQVNIQDSIGGLDGTATSMDESNIKIRTL